MRGKYDIGAKIVRKGRPSTTKNGDLENVKEFNKTVDNKGNVMLGTSFTGRKDFAEKSA